MIEVLPAEAPSPEGLFALALGVARPFPPADDAAEQLFRHLLTLLEEPPTLVEIDIRLPRLHDAEFFGKEARHPRLSWDATDPLRRARLGNDPARVVQVVRAPSIEDAIKDVVRDTGWFSCDAYGVVLDDEVLVDRMYDGIAMDVLSRKPLRAR